jgi:adenylate cyclase
MPSTTTQDPWTLPELTRARRAIVVVDVVESVRLMQEDEAGFIERWRRFVHQVRHEVLPKHGGRMVKSLGDGMLLEFRRVPSAARAAAAMQSLSCSSAITLAAGRSIPLRIGVHWSDIVVDDDDIYGTGVNLAARVASLARPGDVTVSADARDELTPLLDAELHDLGECYLKHVTAPVRAFRITPPAAGEQPPNHQPEHSPGLRPTIAVLPFECENPSQVCSDLFVDSIISRLSRADVFNVVSRLSSSRLRGAESPLTQARSLLGADFVLSGRLHHDLERFTVVAEVAETRSAGVVWSHSGNDTVRSLLTTQCALVETLVEGAKDAVVTHTLRRVRGSELPSLETFALLIGGATLLHRMSRTDFDRAHDLLQAAADRAPRHPSPQAWLAKWHVLRAQQGWVADPTREAGIASDCARRALDADPEDSMAMAMDGLVHVHFTRDLDKAASLYARAVTANPNDALAWLHKGMLHAFRGEGSDGVRDTERAIALSPLDPMKYYFDTLGASAAATAGQYERAIELAERSLRSNCLHTSSLRVLAISQVMLGRGAEASATVARLLALEPGFTVSGFRARAPGAAFEVGQRFARALREAGVPE